MGEITTKHAFIEDWESRYDPYSVKTKKTQYNNFYQVNYRDSSQFESPQKEEFKNQSKAVPISLFSKEIVQKVEPKVVTSTSYTPMYTFQSTTPLKTTITTSNQNTTHKALPKYESRMQPKMPERTATTSLPPTISKPIMAPKIVKPSPLPPTKSQSIAQRLVCIRLFGNLTFLLKITQSAIKFCNI